MAPVIRSAVMMNRRKEDRQKVRNYGRFTGLALLFLLLAGIWTGFKRVEPVVFPVVKHFEITEAVPMGENIAIYGTFDKVRDCAFIDVVAYSGEEFVAVVFGRAPNAPVVSRLVRSQTYGPWILIPKVPTIELYAHHQCETGRVTTKMFSGALVL